MTLTHEEIGESIGATRQTVTRLFSRRKNARLLQVSEQASIPRPTSD